ncbi:MAG: hypothetical protein WC294_08240 [Methanoregula sp.]|jgi:hypothetical protein
MKVQPEDNVENLEPGPAGSSDQGTGQNSGDPGNIRTAKRTRTAPHLVNRVTALRGQGIARPPEPKSILRRQTQADIYTRDAEIPYVKFEAAARNLVCSLMERQDRMNEEIFNKLNDLGYRVEDLEEDRPAAGSASGDTR